MTNHIAKWQRVSGMLGGICATAFVTSKEWGEIARELSDPEYGGTVLPTNRNFHKLRVAPNLLLVNSGSDDQGACDKLNAEMLGEENVRRFAYRRDNLITGKNITPAS